MGRAPEGEEPVDIEALARQQARQAQAHVVQSNWPNALNLPDDSPFQAALGGSKVFSPAGDLLAIVHPVADPRATATASRAATRPRDLSYSGAGRGAGSDALARAPRHRGSGERSMAHRPHAKIADENSRLLLQS